jgi:hypothetical protein
MQMGNSLSQREPVPSLSARYAVNFPPAPSAVSMSMHLAIPFHDSVAVVAISHIRIVATGRAHISDTLSHLLPPSFHPKAPLACPN